MTAPDDVRARLLPCPFCGKPPRRERDGRRNIYFCSEHTHYMHATEWNRRAAHADRDAEVRELVEKGQALAAIVRKQCGGYTSGPGFDALSAARDLDAALAKLQEKP